MGCFMVVTAILCTNNKGISYDTPSSVINKQPYTSSAPSAKKKQRRDKTQRKPKKEAGDIPHKRIGSRAFLLLSVLLAQLSIQTLIGVELLLDAVAHSRKKERITLRS